MVTEKLTAIVFAWLVQVAPPEKFALIPTYPEATETVEERTGRYMEISKDIAEVVMETEKTSAAKRRAAALLTGIAWHESGFAKDVDIGPCAPGRLKKGGCDRGRARGLWQIQAYEVPTRKDGARLALKLARRSITACKKLPAKAQLAAYAGGTCTSKMGQKRSAELFAMVGRLRGEEKGHNSLLPPAHDLRVRN